MSHVVKWAEALRPQSAPRRRSALDSNLDGRGEVRAWIRSSGLPTRQGGRMEGKGLRVSVARRQQREQQAAWTQPWSWEKPELDSDPLWSEPPPELQPPTLCRGGPPGSPHTHSYLQRQLAVASSTPAPMWLRWLVSGGSAGHPPPAMKVKTDVRKLPPNVGGAHMEGLQDVTQLPAWALAFHGPL